MVHKSNTTALGPRHSGANHMCHVNSEFFIGRPEGAREVMALTCRTCSVGSCSEPQHISLNTSQASISQMAINSSESQSSRKNNNYRREEPPSQQSMSSSNHTDHDELREEPEGRPTRQSQTSATADPRGTNHFTDVSAERDAEQIIVSATGDLIFAERVSVAVGSTQWLGQIPEAVLQLLEQNRTQSGRAVQKDTTVGCRIGYQHGPGHTLGH